MCGCGPVASVCPSIRCRGSLHRCNHVVLRTAPAPDPRWSTVTTHQAFSFKFFATMYVVQAPTARVGVQRKHEGLEVTLMDREAHRGVELEGMQMHCLPYTAVKERLG